MMNPFLGEELNCVSTAELQEPSQNESRQITPVCLSLWFTEKSLVWGGIYFLLLPVLDGYERKPALFPCFVLLFI